MANHSEKPKSWQTRWTNYAAAALTGLLANPQHLIQGTMTGEMEFKYDADWYARQAHELAAAMTREDNRIMRNAHKQRYRWRNPNGR